MVTQGRLEDAEQALGQAERTVRAEAEPAAGMRLHYGRGMLEFVSGRHDAALSAFRPPNGWPARSSRRTRSLRGCARTCCKRSYARATRGASSKPSPAWTGRSATG